MPLTKRQKRRLLEVSKMIESSIVVKDDMEEIQLEYVQEIDKAVHLIKNINNDQLIDIETKDANLSAPIKSQKQKNSDLFRKVRQRRDRIKEAQKYTPPPEPELEEAPEWAKRLWKAIAKKCHPDRLSFLELTPVQVARRQIWFLEAKTLFDQRSWSKLIHIGVQVGEYVEDISHKEQLIWLNNEYEGVSNKITNMQRSLAWKWGTNWENVALRISILTTVLNHRGIKVPSREELTEILIKIELD